MTPRELDVWFRGRGRADERAEKAAWKRAVAQAFHTERFARLKRLSSNDLKVLLDQIDGGTKKPGMTQKQLWDMIKATHSIVTARQQRAKQKRRR